MSRLIGMAKAYLRQAESRLEDAEDAFDDRNYPYCLRLSQECVELSLKASLRLVGIEYPKIHDVSEVLLSARRGSRSGLGRRWARWPRPPRPWRPRGGSPSMALRRSA